MKWYLIIQILATGNYLTVADYPSKEACEAKEEWARHQRIIGMMADPMTFSICLPQRLDENKFPKSRSAGFYTCKYKVGKCTILNQ